MNLSFKKIGTKQDAATFTGKKIVGRHKKCFFEVAAEFPFGWLGPV